MFTKNEEHLRFSIKSHNRKAESLHMTTRQNDTKSMMSDYQ